MNPLSHNGDHDHISEIMSFSPVHRSPVHPSRSTINAILELEHSQVTAVCVPSPHSSISRSTASKSNADDIPNYYREDLIEHLLNWPMTKVENDLMRALNDQARSSTRRLTSLRADVHCVRLRFSRQRLELIKTRHYLSHLAHIVHTLRMAT